MMDLETYRRKRAEYAKTYMPEYKKRRRDFFISQHRCADCGGRDEYTNSGRHYCKECCKRKNSNSGNGHQKTTKTDEEIIENMRTQKREYMREYRKLRKDLSLCAQCGKQDALTIAGGYRCQKCREKRNGRPYISHEQKRLENDNNPENAKTITAEERKYRSENGFCYICGAPVKQGETKWSGHPYRLCEKHYEDLLKVGNKAREKYKELHNGQTYGQITGAYIFIGKNSKVERAEV